jgi:hypothetical protein
LAVVEVLDIGRDLHYGATGSQSMPARSLARRQPDGIETSGSSCRHISAGQAFASNAFNVKM